MNRHEWTTTSFYICVAYIAVLGLLCAPAVLKPVFAILLIIMVWSAVDVVREALRWRRFFSPRGRR